MASLLDLVRDERIRDNLPSPAGEFLGRNLELERVASLLDSEGAVQLVGPPGVGKSRLAVEHGRAALSAVARRTAWFCDLTAAEGQMGALAAIGRPLGLTFESGDVDAAVERIGAVLAGLGSVIVLIDNAEAHVDVLGPWIQSWRTATPSARFIVTTRRTIDTLPAIDLRPLKSSDATGLLEDRVRRMRPDFRPDAATRADLEKLARRLDGLPLAIELVAPRLRVLSPRQLLDQLDTSRGPLEGALQRSWELLDDEERHAFSWLSVFNGGFDATAAGALLEDDGVVEVLGRLMDHSLLRSRSTREFPDEPRLFYPVAVRLFAAERLAEHGELDEALARHVDHFVEAGERWDDGVDTGDEVESIRRLIVENANLLAAWEHAEGEDRIRLGLVLHMALQRGGPFHRQYEIVEDTVERAEAAGDDFFLGRALLNRSRVQRWRNDFDASIADLERALECARRSGDFRSEASALRNLAAGFWGRGELDKTRVFADEALRRSLEEESVVDEVTSRNGLGFLLAYTGELDEARSHLEAALQQARTLGDEPGLIALVSSSLAALMTQAGAFDRAELYASEAIEHYRIVDHVRAVPMELLARAEARSALGDSERARSDVDEALQISQRMGFRLVELRVRHVASFVELLAGNPAAALDHALRAIGQFGEGAEQNLVLGARLHVVIARSLQGEVAPAEETWSQVEAMLDERGGGRWAALADVAHGFLALARSKTDEAQLDVAREVANRRFEGDAIADLLAERLANELPADDTPKYRLSPDGRRFQVPGDGPVDITRRKALRGILELLVQLRRDSPGTPAERDEVLEAGWPGEVMTPDSASQRIHVTVKRLRDLGLEELIVTAGDGYMLEPSIEVSIEEIQ